jgi:S1/P1 Nuclease
VRTLVALLLGLVVLGAGREKAFGWAREGHEAVALIAQRLISPGTDSKIAQLLKKGGDKDLVSVACWADEVVLAARGEGPLSADAETQDFNRKFPNNRTWHFINLPLGVMSDEEARKFTSPDDIVHAIARCIQVLESPLTDAHEFTKVQALRLLVHLVADVHQPLHCGTGFYRTDGTDTAELITYPGEAFGKPSDRGGNLLFYGTNPTEQLHALWDTVIVQKIDNTPDDQTLADFLLKNGRPQEIAMTSGDYHDWALAWAVESVRIATLAYLAIAFEKAEFNADKQLIRINIRLPINYLEANQTYTRLQLTKAGVRLAQLLDSIKW